MTIAEPKFHGGQYVYYDGDIHSVIRLLGYQLKTDTQKEGWYYEIDGNEVTSYRSIIVCESSLAGDVDTEFKRMQKRVAKMEDDLEGMLKRYHEYLSKIDNLIKGKNNGKIDQGNMDSD